MMSAETWGVIAAFAGAWVTLLALGAGAFFWLLSAVRENGREFREEIRETQVETRELRKELIEAIRAEGQERRADMQRLFDAWHRHRHDPVGAAYLPGEDD